MNGYMKKQNRERGVALLFAIGILSLLLILGLAFVTNAVVSQKIAQNNSSHSQAKILAQGAINRVAGAVMLYQYQLGNERTLNKGAAGKDDILLADLSTVVSHKTYTTNSGEDALKVKDGTALKDELADNLDKELPAYKRIRFDNGNDTFYEDMEKSGADPLRKPNWVLMDNGKTGADRRIIGRYAYRVLPPRSNSRINLEKILDFKTPTTSDPLFASLHEVPLDNTPLSFWTAKPTTPSGLLTPTLDTFLMGWQSKWATADRNRNSKWLKRWFDDGSWPGDLEVFESVAPGTSLRRFYHRFNLNRNDWDNLNGKGANSDAAVESLLADPVEFRHTSTFDATKKDEESPLDSGLRYLNMIGCDSDLGGFPDYATLRKQIAANIIDYCDTDSVPTSNVPAADWKANLNADPATKWPLYTGNEKTPYINEFAFMFDAVPEIENPNTRNMQIKLTITPTVLAELIDIYELAPPDAYKLHLNLKNINITTEIKAKGRYSILGLPIAIFDPSPQSKVFTFTPTAPIEIDFGTGSWKDGYAIGGTALTAVSQVLSSSELSLPLLDIIAITNLETRVEIKTISFEIKGIALEKSGGGGVDFVRWNETITLSPNKFLFTVKTGPSGILSLIKSEDPFGLKPEEQRFFIAGMQARDPRQNLNVSTNVAKNDWRDLGSIGWLEYDPTISSAGYDETDLLTMRLDLKQSTLAGLLSSGQGLVNKDANPSGRSPDGDLEIVTDPAWKGDDAGADAASRKHLSTAYIADKPMKSLWELGAIHRGVPWQTINLKHAAAPGTAGASSDGNKFLPKDHMDSQWGKGNVIAGTSYYDGDGPILDQVKLGQEARSYGKIDWNTLKIEGGAFPLNDNAFWLKALLADSGATWRGEYDLTNKHVGDYGTNWEDGILGRVGNMTDTLSMRSEILRQKNSGTKVLLPDGANTDREQEEAAGKIMNLMKAGPGLVTTFQVVIIAQTIRDVEGTVFRLDEKGDPQSHDAAYGTFDFNSAKNIYFDDITGEAKLLVTFDRNPSTGKIKVRNVKVLSVADYNTKL